MEPGYSVWNVHARLAPHWKAAYGLELIRITREADMLGELCGRFIEPYYPTEEEFFEARRMRLRETRFIPKEERFITHIRIGGLKV